MTERVLTLGADPEIPLLVRNSRSMSGIQWFPACGIFGGTKGDPYIVNENYGGWLEDGVMLELNPTPSRSSFDLQGKIQALLGTARVKAAEFNAELSPGTSSCIFREEALAKHPSASVFGCDPDFDSYQGGAERNPPMDLALAEWGNGIRFAGGHVHIGLTDWPEDLPKFIATRLLDLLVLLPYLRYYGTGFNERSPYYGLPGLFRTPKHGLEYRTPDPVWIKDNPSAPLFLGRVKAVGNLFKHFEDTKKELISLYNKVPWEDFGNSLARRDLDAATEHLSPIISRHPAGRSGIEICGRVFDLRGMGYFSPEFDRVNNTDWDPEVLEFTPRTGLNVAEIQPRLRDWELTLNVPGEQVEFEMEEPLEEDEDNG